MQRSNRFKRGVLNLDKYVDIKYHKLAKKVGYSSGVLLIVANKLIFVKLGFTDRYFIGVSGLMFCIAVIFQKSNQYLWRLERQINQSVSGYDCGCNRKDMAPISSPYWLKSRISSHFKCTFYISFIYLFLGWFTGFAFLLFV